MPTLDLTEDQYQRILKRFAFRIRCKRLALGMDQGRFATYIGVKAGNTVSRWEGAHNMPRAKRLLVVAERLDVSLDWLMGLIVDQEEDDTALTQATAHREPTIRERVLAYMSSAKGSVTLGQLIRETQGDSRMTAMQTTIIAMAARGEIERVRYGVYRGVKGAWVKALNGLGFAEIPSAMVKGEGRGRRSGGQKVGSA